MTEQTSLAAYLYEGLMVLGIALILALAHLPGIALLIVAGAALNAYGSKWLGQIDLNDLKMGHWLHKVPRVMIGIELAVIALILFGIARVAFGV